MKKVKDVSKSTKTFCEKNSDAGEEELLAYKKTFEDA